MEKSYKWDFIPAIPPSIKELLTSDLKAKTFEIVRTKNLSFSPGDIVDELAVYGINTTPNVVQQFLRLLHIRGYLQVSDFRGDKRRGRSSLRYQIKTKP